jgi:hypothetical protein
MNQRNEYNKVGIGLRVVQFWTELNTEHSASRSCDFVITRLISYTNCTPLSSITIIYYTQPGPVVKNTIIAFWHAGFENTTLRFRCSRLTN